MSQLRLKPFQVKKIENYYNLYLATMSKKASSGLVNKSNSTQITNHLWNPINNHINTEKGGL